jgi:protein-L-isoaspartate(D-aspartate) O-methyltransferase
MRTDKKRKELVEELKASGYIKSKPVENAFLNVSREKFVLPNMVGQAYADNPLPILAGQTISAPSMIAIMLEVSDLKKGLKILEIGAGSGYNAALMAEIAGEDNIITIERHSELAAFAKKNLKSAGYENVKVIEGDGSKGYKKDSPYDRIISTAAAPQITESWKKQLKEGGRIIAPVGGRRFYQELKVLEKKNGGFLETDHGGCVFVPLIGDEGF